MAEELAYKLSKARRRTVMGLAREQGRLKAELEEVVQAFADLATLLAADFGESRPAIFEQRGEDIYLVVKLTTSDVPDGNEKTIEVTDGE